MTNVILRGGRRVQWLLMAIVFILLQFIPLAAITNTTKAGTVTNPCDYIKTVDTDGANDEPGQKDLTQLCEDLSSSGLGYITVSWNWDEINWSGNNSGDACTLFDTDGDGNANYSLCVTVKGSPAAITATTLYSCGDDKLDRCTSPIVSIPSFTSTCSVSTTSTDPFTTGDSYPQDTTAQCNIVLSDVGGGSANMIDVCSYPSQQPNSDPSDCVVYRDKSGKLEVKKILNPSSDNGRFDLGIDSTTVVTNVGNDGTTGEQVVSAGEHSAFEKAYTGTALSSYSTHLECRDLNGTGSVIASGDSTDATQRQLNVNVADGADVVCVITNTRQMGSITVIKNVVNNNGGTLKTADFPLYVDGNLVTSGQPNNYVPGTYTISETQANGYALTGVSGDCSKEANGAITVNLTANQKLTCTITNDDIAPKLIVKKHVVNDNGGKKSASDFKMSVSASNPTHSQFNGDENGTTVTLNAGSYIVEETTDSGYKKTYSGDCDPTTGGGTISIGETKTCTVTNDDLPGTLIINKIVKNDNGGTNDVIDFGYQINGGATKPFEADGSNSQTVDTGSYNITEPVTQGYTPKYDNCTNVFVPNGGTETCTITNDDDAPALTLIKKLVDNYNSGAKDADWTLTATGPTTITGTTPVTSGDSFDAGNYDLEEESTVWNSKAFTPSDWTCVNNKTGATSTVKTALAISLGQTMTCTITNTAVQPRIKVIKLVVDNYGGGKTASDFEMKVTGTDVTLTPGDTGTASSQTFDGSESGTYVYLDAGSFDVTETEIAGYTQSKSSDCSGTVTVGDVDKVCTITNTAIQPKLTLIKEITGNKYGDDATVNDFGLRINGELTDSGITHYLNVGSYSISEDGLAGYHMVDMYGYSNMSDDSENCTNPSFARFSILNDCDGECEDGCVPAPDPCSTGTVDLKLGEEVTCYLVNAAKQPNITLVKKVINDNGGNKKVEDFDLFVDQKQVTSGDTNGFNVGEYLVSETQDPNYTSTISENCKDWKVTLILGDSVTCTITNNDVAPSLKLVKKVINDNGGTAKATDWTLTAMGPTSLTGAGEIASGEDFKAGTYVLSESTMTGYTSLGWSCTNGVNVSNNQITIANGQTTVCTVTNDDNAPILVNTGQDTLRTMLIGVAFMTIAFCSWFIVIETFKPKN